MLQLEVNKLNEETNVMKAQIEVEDAMLTFRSFLGIRGDEKLQVIPEDSVAEFEVSLDEALKQAYEHSPEIDSYERKNWKAAVSWLRQGPMPDLKPTCICGSVYRRLLNGSTILSGIPWISNTSV